MEEPEIMKLNENIKSQYLSCQFQKDWPNASEILVNYIKDKLFIFTTRDDEKSEIWFYENGIYSPNGRSKIKEILRDFLGEYFTAYVVNMAITKLEADSYINSDEFFKNNYPNIIPVQNGLLNVITLKLEPFTPSMIFFSKLPVVYNSKAKCPKINSFLKNVLSQEEDRLVFYELAGFSLIKEYKFEKAFMFVGDGRNGKGKSIELLKKLVGAENCCSIPLTSLIPESFSISELLLRKTFTRVVC